MSNTATFFWRPLHALLFYLEVTIGIILLSVPLAIRVFQQGLKSLQRYSDIFEFLHPHIFGDSIFLWIVGLYSPYSSSIHPFVQKLDASYCVATMDEQPWLLNPFKSIHAAALVNFGEFVTGLCLLSAMQHARNIKGIAKHIDISFSKKARGKISAMCHISLDNITSSCEKTFEVQLFDSKCEEVARFKVTWDLKITLKR